MKPVALTIAGSDSGGGAGIQADLRTFHRLGVFGTSAIAAVTAQNLEGVTGVAGVDPGLVRAQIDAVRGGFPLGAAKTGMLWSREIVEVVAEAELRPVVDPVMVASSGARLLDEEAVGAYRERLLPGAALATPNLDEAAVLLGEERIDPERMSAAADALFERLGCPVLLKGGHLEGDPIDVLRFAGGTARWSHPRITAADTHGSGCILSAAIAARLAAGDELVDACEKGLAFIHDALVRAAAVGGARLADIESAEAETSALSRLE